MELVEDQHLARPLDRRPGREADDVASVLDGDARTLPFLHHDIGMDAAQHPPARLAGAVSTGRAQQRGRERRRGGALARSWRADQQVRVDRVGDCGPQTRDGPLLADHTFEQLRQNGSFTALDTRSATSGTVPSPSITTQ